MNQKNINPLLDKYYQGDTSLEEEALLKNEIRQGENRFPEEKDIFEYFEEEAYVPENLKAQIFDRIKNKNNRSKIIRRAWFKYSSIAAACLFALMSWFNMNSQRTGEMSIEQQFTILEQALFEVSNSIQPAQDDDLLVLFQDENLEILMN